MLQKLFSIRVDNKRDMSRLEEVVVGLLGGECNRCSFLRSGEYLRFRNIALYSRASAEDSQWPVSVHFEGLKLTLTATRVACIYVTDPCVIPVDPSPATGEDIDREDEVYLVGKKRRAVTPPSPGDVGDENEEWDG
jgi:hypothetical protein